MKTQYFSRGELTSFPIPVLSGTGKKLSLSESGFFNFLFNKPEGWIFHYSEICIELSTGKNKVAAMLQKLSDEGLIQRKRQYKNGRVCGFTIDFTSPNTESSKLHTEELNTRNYIPKIENHKLYTDKTITDNIPHSYSPCENPYENKKNNNSSSLNSSSSYGSDDYDEAQNEAVAVEKRIVPQNTVPSRNTVSNEPDLPLSVWKDELLKEFPDVDNSLVDDYINLRRRKGIKNCRSYLNNLIATVSAVSSKDEDDHTANIVFLYIKKTQTYRPLENNVEIWIKDNDDLIWDEGYHNKIRRPNKYGTYD